MYKSYNALVIALASTTGSLLFGFDITSVSAFLDNKAYLDYFNYPDSTEQGGITASMAGGSFCGSLASGWISDRYGRRLVLMLSGFIWIIGAAIQCSSQNVAQLIIGRFIAGIAIGFESGQVPVYIAEIAPPHLRGSLGALFQWAITWGIMINFYICYGCSFIKGPNAFRAGWGIQMIPGLLFLLCILILPESPRWLAAHGKEDQAKDILLRVNSKKNNSEKLNEEIEVQWNSIIESIQEERRSKQGSFFDLFKSGSRTRTFVAVSAQMWQQMCGMNVLMYYIVYIFTMAGYSGNSNLVSASIQYVINVIMTIPPIIWLDSWGRRPVLLIGAILMTIWLFAIGGVMKTYGHYTTQFDNQNIRWIVPDKKKAKCIIAFSYLFVASFAPTWGPTVWVYCSEIFPLSQRARANGLGAATNWIFNFALAFFVPPAIRNIQWKTYMIFGTFTTCSLIEVFLLFPETRGRTLEEIDEIWKAHVPAWKTRSLRHNSISNLEREKSEIKEKTLSRNSTS